MRRAAVRDERPADGGAIVDIIDGEAIVKSLRVPTVNLVEKARMEAAESLRTGLANEALKSEVEIEGDDDE